MPLAFAASPRRSSPAPRLQLLFLQLQSTRSPLCSTSQSLAGSPRPSTRNMPPRPRRAIVFTQRLSTRAKSRVVSGLEVEQSTETRRQPLSPFSDIAQRLLPKSAHMPSHSAHLLRHLPFQRTSSQPFRLGLPSQATSIKGRQLPLTFASMLDAPQRASRSTSLVSDSFNAQLMAPRPTQSSDDDSPFLPNNHPQYPSSLRTSLTACSWQASASHPMLSALTRTTSCTQTSRACSTCKKASRDT